MIFCKTIAEKYYPHLKIIDGSVHASIFYKGESIDMELYETDHTLDENIKALNEFLVKRGLDLK